MHVYLVVVNDRHCDLEVQAYVTIDSALDAAEKTVLQMARHEKNIEWDYKLNQWQINDGVCWLVPYSCENDYVQVLSRELNS